MRANEDAEAAERNASREAAKAAAVAAAAAAEVAEEQAAAAAEAAEAAADRIAAAEREARRIAEEQAKIAEPGWLSSLMQAGAAPEFGLSSKNDDPIHLGLQCNAFPGHQMALITSVFVPGGVEKGKAGAKKTAVKTEEELAAEVEQRVEGINNAHDATFESSAEVPYSCNPYGEPLLQL